MFKHLLLTEGYSTSTFRVKRKHNAQKRLSSLLTAHLAANLLQLTTATHTDPFSAEVSELLGHTNKQFGSVPPRGKREGRENLTYGAVDGWGGGGECGGGMISYSVQYPVTLPTLARAADNFYC